MSTPAFHDTNLPVRFYLSGGNREPASSSRAGFTKQHRSPEELLSQLAPPKCTFGLNHLDHRWTSAFKVDASHLLPPYSQKMMTKSFGPNVTWQSALRSVHSFNWEKWAKLRDQAPLPPGCREQVPGQISEDVLRSLADVVAGLPPVRRDSKQKVGAS